MLLFHDVLADINNITYDVWSFVLVVGEPVFRPLVLIFFISSLYKYVLSQSLNMFNKYYIHGCSHWFLYLQLVFANFHNWQRKLTRLYDFRSTSPSTSASLSPMTTSTESTTLSTQPKKAFRLDWVKWVTLLNSGSGVNRVTIYLSSPSPEDLLLLTFSQKIYIGSCKINQQSVEPRRKPSETKVKVMAKI